MASADDRTTDVLLTDVHAHFVTDDYVAAARAAGIEHPDGMPAWPDWGLDAQLADMDRRRIGRAILSISSPGVHFGDDAAAAALARDVNDAAADLVAARPGRLSFFASLPLPDVEAARTEARRALALPGARGVILESHAQGQYLGDPALEPLWADLEAAGAIVFVHPTSPVGAEGTDLGRPRPMLEFMADSTRSIVDLVLAGVLERHPALQVVVPHSGASLALLSDRVALFQSAFGLGGMPFASALQRLWFDLAGTPFPHAAPLLARVAGEEHLLYGSDSCWTPAPAVDALLESIEQADPPASATSWRALTARNADRLLGEG
ncbi:amidohydrolase [Brachybacterium endophyticum]|uniref:6-methylsalicylate decarboxylase n=1 Tax=Brachybacterium endophyticum TaxID=2182385 RepID=A0A2U2RNY6_9MICO|nr:amidohydrolase family protein [Brachybacterium endophyticum]PWH07505.1 amidohydrolase [Brachybacterium endophyticum]